MQTVSMIPFVSKGGEDCFQIKINGEWIASVHRSINGGRLVHMFWSEHGHKDAEVRGLKGGLPAAYDWAMRMHRKHPEWVMPSSSLR